MSFFKKLFSSSASSSSSPKGEAGGAVRTIRYYTSEAAQPLQELINAEYAAGRKPVVYFTAEWAPPCKLFEKSLKDQRLKDALAEATLIMLDIDTDSEKEGHASAHNVRAVPSFLRLDKDGKLIKRMTGNDWEADTPAKIAPVVRSFVQS